MYDGNTVLTLEMWELPHFVFLYQNDVLGIFHAELTFNTTSIRKERL